MSIIETIARMNEEGRKVVWPGPTARCSRCNEPAHPDDLDLYDYCETCHDDMLTPWPSSAKAYIEAAQPVFPYKEKST